MNMRKGSKALTNPQKKKVANFLDATGCSSTSIGADYLKKAGWDLNAAAELYFTNPPQAAPAPVKVQEEVKRVEISDTTKEEFKKYKASDGPEIELEGV